MMPNLFNEFEKVSSKQWKNKIQYELDGADYNKTLIWESLEGIKVKPFYHNDVDFVTNAVQTENTSFKIVQEIFVHDVEKSINRANNVLKRGADSIRFIIENEKTDVITLLNGIVTDAKTLYFQLNFLSVDFILKINAEAKKKSFPIFVLIDPIHQLGKDGNWFKNIKFDFENLNSIAVQCKNIHFLSVNGQLYQNAGANIVQQLAYILAHANEYLNRVPNFKDTVTISVSVGSNYFFEIAKLRALRLLFETLVKEYNQNIDLHIIATPSKRNKTIYDSNVNMLRTTTECMSAILGGANAIENINYDVLYHKSNEFGSRLSRNQLLILKRESYFDKVNNPADGSYYIENLTQQLAEKALILFKDIEANGGLITQLIKETIQRKIVESATKEQNLFDEGKEVLLGSNTELNIHEKMAEELALFPFVKKNPRKTLVSPIIEKRLTEALDQVRLNKEKNVNL